MSHADKKLIEDLGGPAKVAERLGYDKRSGGLQRVQNWVTRGIPSKVKLKHPDLFLPELGASSSESRATSEASA